MTIYLKEPTSIFFGASVYAIDPETECVDLWDIKTHVGERIIVYDKHKPAIFIHELGHYILYTIFGKYGIMKTPKLYHRANRIYHQIYDILWGLNIAPAGLGYFIVLEEVGWQSI